MDNHNISCPACGACYDNQNLIVCPSCGADLHPYIVGAPQKYNIFTAYISMFKRFSDFKGRSRRSEFWYAYLANFIIIFVMVGLLMIIDYLAVRDSGGSGEFAHKYVNAFNIVYFIFNVYAFVTLVPQIALIIRRLHDTGRSALYALFMLLAPVGSAVLMVFLAFKGTSGYNKYGPDPCGGMSD